MSIKNHKPIQNGQYKQGYYRILNEAKYRGNKFEIIYRSSWELDFCKFLDSNPSVIAWSSEPFHIEYHDIFDNRTRKYYPDFAFVLKNADGTTTTHVAEIKPMKDMTKPTPPKRCTDKTLKTYEYASKVYMKNTSKRIAAEKYCKERGWQYTLISEDWFKRNQFAINWK